jgi:hypothetical protein
MSKFFLLIAVALSVSFECSILAQSDKPKAKEPIINLVSDISESGLELWSTRSTNGLEGFGDNGVSILIVDYSDLEKDFPAKQIQTQVELRLRQSKIKVVKNSDFTLLIHVLPVESVKAYSIHISANRLAYFTAANLAYKKSLVSVWEALGVYSKSKLRGTISRFMDEFLLAQLNAQEHHEKVKKAYAPKKSAAKPSSATPTKK